MTKNPNPLSGPNKLKNGCKFIFNESKTYLVVDMDNNLVFEYDRKKIHKASMPLDKIPNGCIKILKRNVKYDAKSLEILFKGKDNVRSDT